ncbi:hypothetical protein [Cognatiyoonia sediminum]|uniref:hypothetical protein n=1 Tax=Cognatiyoonia sediminum TaxID=1508389 RepID=UPI00093462E5|nr:hypothetical protein [Cognatiyoonia sediminum]
MNTFKIISDLRFGRFSILTTRGMDRFKDYGFTRLRGEFVIDTPAFSVIVTNERKATPAIKL